MVYTNRRKIVCVQTFDEKTTEGGNVQMGLMEMMTI
jgi:hypothetical protein